MPIKAQSTSLRLASLLIKVRRAYSSHHSIDPACTLDIPIPPVRHPTPSLQAQGRESTRVDHSIRLHKNRSTLRLSWVHLDDRFFFFARFDFLLAADDFDVRRCIVFDDARVAERVDVVFRAEVIWVKQSNPAACNANHTSLNISSLSFFRAHGFMPNSRFRLGTLLGHSIYTLCFDTLDMRHYGDDRFAIQFLGDLIDQAGEVTVTVYHNPASDPFKRMDDGSVMTVEVSAKHSQVNAKMFSAQVPDYVPSIHDRFHAVAPQDVLSGYAGMLFNHIDNVIDLF